MKRWPRKAFWRSGLSEDLKESEGGCLRQEYVRGTEEERPQVLSESLKS